MWYKGFARIMFKAQVCQKDDFFCFCSYRTLVEVVTGARGMDHPPFSNFLFTNLFSVKFLYFFIISSLCPYFNLFMSIFIQSYVNSNFIHVSTLYTFLYILIIHKARNSETFKIVHHVSIHKRRRFPPLSLFCAYDSSVLQNFKIFAHPP